MKTVSTAFRARSVLGVVLFAAVLASRLEAAQLKLYTDAGSYQAASYTIDTIEFDGSTSSQTVSTEYSNGPLEVGDVSFTTPSGTDLAVVGPGVTGFDFAKDDTATLDGQTGMKTPAVIDITLPLGVTPAGISAVGFDIGDGFAGGTITAVFTFSGGETASDSFTVYDAMSVGLDYVGFVAPTGYAIDSIKITDTSTGSVGIPDLVIDNFSYGVASPDAPAGSGASTLQAIPEPSLLPLAGVGALALLLYRRRHGRSSISK